MASDQDFTVVRRFDRLHVRIFLALQAQISRKEDHLHALEKGYMDAHDDIDNGRVSDDTAERTRLLGDCTALLDQYDRMLVQYLDLACRPRAQEKNIKSLWNWFENNNGAIVDEEAGFKDHEEDLICFNSSSRSTARQMFDHWMLKYTRGVFRCFAKERMEVDIGPMNNAHIYISNDNTVNKFATGVLFFVGLSVLVLPLWLLWLLEKTEAKLAIVIVFILIFLLLLLACTVARPLQALAATAA